MSYTPVGTQADVITTRASLAVVLGGAGTGKTITAAAAAASHLRQSDVARGHLRRDLSSLGPPLALPARDRVLFISFSRTAVAQVLDRAAAVVRCLIASTSSRSTA